ncbi:hypothetical protein [Xanthomonas vasicola]|uniref:Uncharacterized protein n=1 Tax=Xanthomonas vasicola pv. vasculorum NCPPB 890 TaxID=1184265 RepID=A0A836ZSF6_XANVA|nr:hypothetical protein [Xanthomonas vasicola]KFA37310.1 hypothetical protein KWS_0110100 [Xanthomonas vasicola pv. musacearum NCPPB 4384]AZR31257.1 hypothetical protein KWO_012710 [Xanthomonas vasicola pv. musacearum NCPPB 4379]AZR34675.1 hypothetical protein NX08_009505 [Xanthomonas vasicola]KFA11486.1 hypothetical protein KWM_0106390 [Xanthomonas vasicola pv. musacearum NCPPB 2005]KFA15142.1 hypothetical protein KWQ_0102650 [Xanthomonas vasicola pv. musacearum NCPPB 4380]
MSDKIPTERQVLRCIYDMYLPNYPFQPEKGSIGQFIIPIDVEAVATRLGTSKYLLFGYLNSYLDHKYRQKTGENSAVHLFAPVVGDMRNAVNFPYLAAILAGHDQEHSKFAWSLGVSLVALALSVGAIIAQVVAR